MVDMHLYSAFRTSGHAKRCTILPNIHPFMPRIHTLIESTMQGDSQLVGRSEGEVSCLGTPRHSTTFWLHLCNRKVLSAHVRFYHAIFFSMGVFSVLSLRNLVLALSIVMHLILAICGVYGEWVTLVSMNILIVPTEIYWFPFFRQMELL